MHSIYNTAGRFNLRVVTTVTNKLERLWLCEVPLLFYTRKQKQKRTSNIASSLQKQVSCFNHKVVATPNFRQTGETVVMRGWLRYSGLIA